MRYPGRAAGGMRRVRCNAASKLNNGRCTSQISAMSSRRASGESCAIAASLLALEDRKVDITWEAQVLIPVMSLGHSEIMSLAVPT